MIDKNRQQFSKIKDITSDIYLFYLRAISDQTNFLPGDLYEKVQEEQAIYQKLLEERKVSDLLEFLQSEYLPFEECPLEKQLIFSDSMILYRIYFQLRKLENIDNIELYNLSNGKLYDNSDMKNDCVFSKSGEALLELAECDQEEVHLHQFFTKQYHEFYLLLLKRQLDMIKKEDLDNYKGYTNLLFSQVFLYQTMETILIDSRFNFLKYGFGFDKSLEEIYPKDEIEKEIKVYAKDRLEEEISQLLYSTKLDDISLVNANSTVLKIKALFLLCQEDDRMDLMNCFVNVEDRFIKNKTSYDSKLPGFLCSDIYSFLKDVMKDPLVPIIAADREKVNKKTCLNYETIYAYQRAELYYLKKMFGESDNTIKRQYYKMYMDCVDKENSLLDNIPKTTLLNDYNVIVSSANDKRFNFTEARDFSDELVNYRMISQFRKRLGEYLFDNEILDHFLEVYQYYENEEIADSEKRELRDNSLYIYQAVNDLEEEYHEVFLSVIHNNFKKLSKKEILKNKKEEYSYCFSFLLDDHFSFVDSESIRKIDKCFISNGFVNPYNYSEIINTFYKIQLSMLFNHLFPLEKMSKKDELSLFFAIEALTATYVEKETFNPKLYFETFTKDFLEIKGYPLPFIKEISDAISRGNEFFHISEKEKNLYNNLDFSYIKTLDEFYRNDDSFKPTLYEEILITEYEIFRFYNNYLNESDMSDANKSLERDFLEKNLKKEEMLFSKLANDPEHHKFYSMVSSLSNSTYFCDANYYLVEDVELIYSRIFYQYNRLVMDISPEIMSIDYASDEDIDDGDLIEIAQEEFDEIGDDEDIDEGDLIEIAQEEFGDFYSLEEVDLLRKIDDHYDETVYLILAIKYKELLKSALEKGQDDDRAEQELVDLQKYLYYWVYTHPSVEKVTKVFGFATYERPFLSLNMEDVDAAILNKVKSNLFYHTFYDILENNLFTDNILIESFPLEEFPIERKANFNESCLKACFSVLTEKEMRNFLSSILKEIREEREDDIPEERVNHIYKVLEEYKANPVIFENKTDNDKFSLTTLKYLIPKEAKEIVSITEILYKCKKKMSEKKLSGNDKSDEYYAIWKTYQEYAEKEEKWYSKNYSEALMKNIASTISSIISVDDYETYFLDMKEDIISHRILNQCNLFLDSDIARNERKTTLIANLEDGSTSTLTVTEYKKIYGDCGDSANINEIVLMSHLPQKIKFELDRQFTDVAINLLSTKLESLAPSSNEEFTCMREISNLFESLIFTNPNSEYEYFFRKLMIPKKVSTNAMNAVYNQSLDISEGSFEKMSVGYIEKMISNNLNNYLNCPERASIKIFRRTMVISSNLLAPSYDISDAVYSKCVSDYIMGDINEPMEVTLAKHNRVTDADMCFKPKILKKLEPFVYLVPKQ